MNTVAVVPTYNNSSLFLLLEQLAALHINIVVVDNGCSDDISSLVRQATGSCDYIQLHENTGGSGGFLAGVEYALKKYPVADYFWLLDDDVKITDDTMNKLLSAATELNTKGIKWGAIASMMLEMEKPDIVTEIGAAIDWWKIGLKPYDRGKMISDIEPGVYNVQYGAAASLLVKPATICEIGFFENIFIHFDDVDWCLRLRKSGYEIYCATESKIWHPTSLSKPATWVRYYDVRNFIWLCRRHNKKFLFWVVLLLFLKGIYFYLHDLRLTAMLYFIGIADAFGGRLRLRDELKYEAYSVEEKFCLAGRRIACIFRNYEHFNSFKEKRLSGNKIKLFLYERVSVNHEACITQATSNSCVAKFMLGMKSCLYSLFIKNDIVVIDDALRGNFMFPVMGKRKMIYNHYLDKFVNHDLA